MILRNLKENWRLALGEVALVFVGVLLALAADGWRERQVDRSLETQYLQAFERDLQADIEDLADVVERSERLITEPLRVAVKELVADEITDGDPVALVQRLGMAAYTNLPRWHDAAYTDLIASGRSQLLRDFDLRQRLIEYYSRQQYYDRYFESFLDAKVGFDLAIPQRHLDASRTGIELDVPLLPSEIQALFDDPNLENEVLQAVTIQEWLDGSLTGRQEDARVLLELVRTALRG